MNLENDWRNKTILELEKKDSVGIAFDSHLIKEVNKLLQKPLNTFSIEDLRLMIGQQIGLKYLVLLAIEVLEKDLFAVGNFYEGDLLQCVLNIESKFWNDYQSSWIKLDGLIAGKEAGLSIRKIKTTTFYSK
ncbi:hypothetical protein JN11_00171 [Mucilaginibacter frigoritolerans]|jgi:hypothetical protein|uniref:Uncharacterized protein n=1 Tax=Mucilaginibacter frigoritolerans TaxID=652788 RepID=A0A562UF75_9SPHI|nr:contact-dependent growth inhibition system immunity protein [Mucilaginibacter frigoritolerans]TWJ04462.1 hypothetical protein JN11_00171 [Mucilaginibacter frigoritolerans]